MLPSLLLVAGGGIAQATGNGVHINPTLSSVADKEFKDSDMNGTVRIETYNGQVRAVMEVAASKGSRMGSQVTGFVTDSNEKLAPPSPVIGQTTRSTTFDRATTQWAPCPKEGVKVQAQGTAFKIGPDNKQDSRRLTATWTSNGDCNSKGLSVGPQSNETPAGDKTDLAALPALTFGPISGLGN